MKDFFELGLEVYTTAYVIAEVKDEQQSEEVNEHISTRRLQVDQSNTYEAIQHIFDECKGLSFADCSVLEMAIRTGARILSSDKALRKEAKRRSIEVRGFLWITTELVIHSIITKENAILKLKQYIAINNRAPKQEVYNLIKKFSET